MLLSLLLTLFLTTAFPTFLLMENPYLSPPYLFWKKIIERCWVKNDFPFLYTKLNSLFLFNVTSFLFKVWLYAVSFFLPLLRLLFNTLRPFNVAIRLRKPCTFLRWRFFGWKVLFIIYTSRLIIILIYHFMKETMPHHKKTRILYSKRFLVSIISLCKRDSWHPGIWSR